MKNIIFDFGNVLVRWQPELVYNRYFGSEARSWYFLRHVCTSEWRARIDAGEDQDACIAELQHQYPEYAEAAALYRDRWQEMLPCEVEGMRELLTDLKACAPLGKDPLGDDSNSEVRLFGLTNWSMQTFPQSRQHFPILQMIDHYVVSGAEGMVKPDERLFRLLMDRYHLQATDCIFIDDNPANLEAARRLGMQGIVFENAQQLRRDLGLYRPLTSSEIEQLERQGNECYNWLRVRIAEGADLSRIAHNRFKHDIMLGHNVVVNHSYLIDCTVGDGTLIDDVRRIANVDIGRDCRLTNVGEISCNPEGIQIAVMNENGGRTISAFPGMTIADACLMARYRDRTDAQPRLASMSQQAYGGRGAIGDRTTIRNATALIDGIIAPDCTITHGVIAQRFVLGENVRLEDGLRLNDSVVGDNSTLARGEVGNALIFPAHEQHHNNSFLIAALTLGQSNVAAGATLGSNHNGRTADGEMVAGRGFWPALCVSIKHSSRFASYTLLTKADYPSELNITLPFSLVSNNTSMNRLEVMPAYWWLYNMYALNRNMTKFASRERRHLLRQHIEFSPLAPDTAEEIIMARSLIHLWTTRAYQEAKDDTNSTQIKVYAHGMERSHRPTLLLKPAEGYRAYEEMLIYYAMQTLTAHYADTLPPAHLGQGERIIRWDNLGGQLVAGTDADALLDDIASGKLTSWAAIHARLDDLWSRYEEQRTAHAYHVLCHLSQTKLLSADQYTDYLHRYATIKQLVADRITASRQKDADNEFRHATYRNAAEMQQVLNS